MNHRDVKYPKQKDPEFFQTLKSRVKEYFEANNISKHANTAMVIKTVFMISLYMIPYFLMVLGVVTNVWAVFFLWIVMGVGISGIGLSIMHDANHGSYSSNKNVNKILGHLLNFIGGSSLNWKYQHNILHHSYTNVDGVDEDIAPVGILRFSPHAKKRWFHRFQYIYVWFFYGLMTFSWVISKDFTRLYNYKKMGLTNNQKRSFNALLFELILSKVLYLSYIVVIPILVLPIVWWQVLLFFFCMHFVAGLILACIFQPAHVVPECEFPMVDESNKMENNWAIHQLLTTSNFAPESRWFSWFVGGLNFQVEHHLFPNICHVHYKKLSEIVKQTANEYGLPYHSQPTFARAIYNHARMIKQLGR